MDLKDKDCSDDYLNVIIDDVRNSLSDSYPITILVLLCIYIIMDPTFTYLIGNCFRCREDRSYNSNAAVIPKINDINSISNEKIIHDDNYSSND